MHDPLRRGASATRGGCRDRSDRLRSPAWHPYVESVQSDSILPMRQTRAFVLALAITAVVLSGCGSGNERINADPSPTENGVTSSPTSSPTRHTDPPSTPRPTRTPEPAARWTITCYKGSTTQQQSFTSLPDVWTQLPEARLCRGEYTGGGTFEALPEEQAVIDILAPHWQGQEKPANVYGVALGVCAEASEEPIVLLYARAGGALCPEAPHGALLVGLGDGSIFGDGSRIIGTDTPAGTYITAPGVRDCYWERSSGGGDILANDVVTFAPDGVAVTVNDGEGFTSDHCGRWTRQP